MSKDTNTPAEPIYRRTREDWLHRAIDELRPMFEQVGFPLPEVMHVSVGFGGSGAGKYERFVEGVTWHTSVDACGHNHVFISPAVGDTAHVLEILVHELVHVALNNQDGHSKRFKQCMEALGMMGPWTAAKADIALMAELMVMAAELGEYPHGALTIPVGVQTPDREIVPVGGGRGGGRVSSGPKAQTNRWFVFKCPEHKAPIRMSRGQAANGAPFCGHRDDEGVPCLKETLPAADVDAAGDQPEA